MMLEPINLKGAEEVEEGFVYRMPMSVIAGTAGSSKGYVGERMEEIFKIRTGHIFLLPEEGFWMTARIKRNLANTGTEIALFLLGRSMEESPNILRTVTDDLNLIYSKKLQILLDGNVRLAYHFFGQIFEESILKTGDFFYKLGFKPILFGEEEALFCMNLKSMGIGENIFEENSVPMLYCLVRKEGDRYCLYFYCLDLNPKKVFFEMNAVFVQRYLTMLLAETANYISIRFAGMCI